MKSVMGTFSYVQVMSVPNDKDDENGQQMKQLMDEDFDNVEIIGEVGDNTYYFAYNTDYSDVDATNEEKETLEYMAEQIDSLRNSICISPAEKSEPSENSVETISGFNAETLDGETVTDNIFSDYYITMINVWATYCGPCKDEMEDLGELYDSIPDGINLISICADADEEKELAQTILDTNSCKFTTLIPDDVLTDKLLSKVSGVPATFFVDSEGNVIGEPLTGNRTKDAYLSELIERAESLYSEVNPVK